MLQVESTGGFFADTGKGGMPVRLLLEAVSGPVAGRRIEVKQGTILRIGRTAKSDYVIAEDPYLSSQHFSVECDGLQCRVRDLASSNGTFVNGARITETVVQQEDTVMAGGSSFLIRIESEPAEAEQTGRRTGIITTATVTLPGIPGAILAEQIANGSVAAPIGNAWSGYSRPQTNLLTALYRGGAPLYAILDPSREARIPAYLDAAGSPYAPLEDGPPSPDRALRTPYLVGLPGDSRLLDVLVKDGWGQGWGFYVNSLAGLEEVRRHLAGFLAVRSRHGCELRFPFYDPRVLRILLPAMSPRETADFFGPLSRLVVEAEAPQTALEFRTSPQGAEQTVLPLA